MDIQHFISTITQGGGMQRSAFYRCLLPVRNVALFADNSLRTTHPIDKALSLLEEGILCESTRTPSRSFETTTLALFGFEEKYPHFTTYTDLECTFFAPLLWSGNPGNSKSTNQVADVFMMWQQAIQSNPLEGLSGTGTNDMVMSFPDDYRLQQGMRLDLMDAYQPPSTRALGLGFDFRFEVPLVGSIGFGTDRPSYVPEDIKPTKTYNFFNIYPLTVESSPVSWSAVDDFQRITVTFAYSYWSGDSGRVFGSQS